MTIAYDVQIKGYHNVDFGQALVMKSDETTFVDLTGTQFKMTIADTVTGTIVKTLSNALGITITDAINGAWRFDLTEVDMTALGVGKFKHEMIWTQGTYSQVLWTGKMTILKGIGTP